MYKKGAMFGLDARIALAIFGALSVISGAALYSAIQESKVTAVITDLNELGKAFEQYLLDTGQEMPRISTSLTIYDPTSLTTDPGVKGWKGPYVSYNEFKNGNTGFKYPPYPDYLGTTIRIANDDTWGGAAVNPSDIDCSAKQCYVWIQLYVNNTLASAIDKKVDETLSVNTGSIRIFRHPDGVQSAVYLKYMPSLTEDNTSL